MAEFDVQPSRNAAGDSIYDDPQDKQRALVADSPGHKMDGPEARALHRKLLTWYYAERDLQAENRLEMAIDCDFYDGLQWSPEDAAAVEERGQAPLVYNEVAPMVDWMIGTERRTRVDWRVLPRTEDDVQMADVKTKVLKYLSDVNRSQFVRSWAFADAMKAGIGWIDDGVRDDPTKEKIYKAYEDWRNVMHDSMGSRSLDIEDGRYVFRWRRVDEDIALMMFPDRADLIRKSADYQDIFTLLEEDEVDGWGTAFEQYAGRSRRGRVGAADEFGSALGQRRMVKLIECQFKMPVRTKLIASGPFAGAILSDVDAILDQVVRNGSTRIVDKMMMRTHVAVFTETGMLVVGPTAARHNRFSLTPIFCYRRSRDRQPYGMVRRVRGVQQDLNKRASKALFMLSTNQVIMEENAVDDVDAMIEEVARPDGVIVKKRGSEFTLHRDTEGANGQVEMMGLAAQSIQKSAGVAQENLGRQTNAVSGEAIKARQTQGSVVTTEPFDNLRFATQISGEKELSLAEQFLTEEKVVRIVGADGRIDWQKVNTMELDPETGEVRVLDDITASMADFVVSEQDYAGTLRQVMLENISQIAQRQAPEVALRLMAIAMQYSDLPNKDEIVAQFRKITGEPDPNQEPTPEELEAQQKQRQAAEEAAELQRQGAIAALQEQQAKVRKLNAEADKLIAEANAAGVDPGAQRAVDEGALRAKAVLSDTVERLQQELANSQSELQQLLAKRDTDENVARIQGEAQVRAAEANYAAEKRIGAVESELQRLREMLTAAPSMPAAPAAPPEDPTPSPSPAQRRRRNVQFTRGPDGRLAGATVVEEDDSNINKE